ncbi:MAG TPA: DUF3488 and transglutaminase-like domain-containing protein [Acidimicrobiales bacterium]|nr:DUF3488 and transglutaminase-like domain-containing protein [Acidimicrobiales bacterium]
MTVAEPGLASRAHHAATALPAGPDGSPGRVPGSLRLATEVALGLVTVAAVLGMNRLFEDGSYRAPLVAQAVLAHVVVTSLRRANLRLVPAGLATAGTAVLAVAWARFPDTVRWGLPTAATLRAAGDDLAAAWSLFGEVRAPAPVENGFVVGAAVAVWALAFLADWAAFRTAAAFEALLPATVLFVFSAALAGPGTPVAGPALFAVCALAFVLLHRTAAQAGRVRWAGGGGPARRGRRALLGSGLAVIAAGVVAGAVVGPRLPGAGGEPVLAWRDITRDDATRVVLSPIVSLQTKLLQQPDVQLFTVRSPRSAYWRLTSLDEFDGEAWRSSYRTEGADGELPRAVPASGDARTVTQEITIDQLGSVWLPGAFEPRAVRPASGRDVLYDQRSATLMVDRDLPTSDGLSYTVTSAVPDWSGAELRAASTRVPREVADRYLPLPADFPERAAAEARRVTAAAPTPYDEALALQGYLRSGRFTYDTDVGVGHGNQALLTFLFETRRGYCEQFAAAFAALARSVGLPARVAVGFTPGIQDDEDPTLYSVRGVHAHAWPEVYLGEYGWVPFEPTVGRGPPRGRSWLGVGEQQDTRAGGARVTDPGPEPAADGGVEAPGGTPDQADGRRAGEGLEVGTATGPANGPDPGPTPGDAVGRLVATLGGALLAYAVLVPSVLAAQRAIRRRRARDPVARIGLAWDLAIDGAVDAGVALPAWSTVAEKADRMTVALPEVAARVSSLAWQVEQLDYAGIPPTVETATRALEDGRAVAGAARHRQPSWRRMARGLDVRRLARRPTGPTTTRQAGAG